MHQELKLILRENLLPNSRNKALHEITTEDVINYEGPCVLVEDSALNFDKLSWEYKILDKEFEKAMDNFDGSFLTMDDLNNGSWICYILRKYNGEIVSYPKYCYV